MATVEERVKQIIVEQLGVDEAEVTPKASFVDDLGADSLDTVELVMAFEEAFDVRFRTRTRRKSAPFRMRFPISTRTPKQSRSAVETGRQSSRAIRRQGWPREKELAGLMASVDERVKQIIVEQLGVDEGEVTANASFVDDLGADSLDTVELVMAFEEAFDIEIPDEEAEKIRTVKDAIDYINAHSKGK